MSSQLAWYLIGFLCGFIPCVVLAVWYYARAIRRVRKIQEGIREYEKAREIVGEAVKKTYGEK